MHFVVKEYQQKFKKRQCIHLAGAKPMTETQKSIVTPVCQSLTEIITRHIPTFGTPQNKALSPDELQAIYQDILHNCQPPNPTDKSFPEQLVEVTHKSRISRMSPGKIIWLALYAHACQNLSDSEQAVIATYAQPTYCGHEKFYKIQDHTFGALKIQFDKNTQEEVKNIIGIDPAVHEAFRKHKARYSAVVSILRDSQYMDQFYAHEAEVAFEDEIKDGITNGLSRTLSHHVGEAALNTQVHNCILSQKIPLLISISHTYHDEEDLDKFIRAYWQVQSSDKEPTIKDLPFPILEEEVYRMLENPKEPKDQRHKRWAELGTQQGYDLHLFYILKPHLK